MLDVFLVVAVLAATAHSQLIVPHVLFNYQSQNLTVTDWFDFLTVCLAPLVAHIVGGVVPVTVISGSSSQSPSWLARLPHFNPISITWRYYAIADRRVRAREWDALDMAACNAVFWDGERGRWDGSEEILVRSRAWITKVPECPRTSLLSPSILVTLVLSIQGAQALFLIVEALIPDARYHFGIGLPYLFFPLGCLGVTRLPAALWLSSDYGYLNMSGLDVEPALTESSTVAEKLLQSRVEQSRINRQPLGALISGRLHGRSSAQGIAYRIWWIISIISFLGISAASCSKIWWGYPSSKPYIPLSKLAFDAMYLATTVAGLAIHCTYVVVGRTGTTLIPCIHAAWYKMFTLLLMVTACATLILMALETRKQLNGTTTTFPPFNCGNATLCVPVTSGFGDDDL